MCFIPLVRQPLYDWPNTKKQGFNTHSLLAHLKSYALMCVIPLFFGIWRGLLHLAGGPKNVLRGAGEWYPLAPGFARPDLPSIAERVHSWSPVSSSRLGSVMLSYVFTVGRSRAGVRSRAGRLSPQSAATTTNLLTAAHIRYSARSPVAARYCKTAAPSLLG